MGYCKINLRLGESSIRVLKVKESALLNNMVYASHLGLLGPIKPTYPDVEDWYKATKKIFITKYHYKKKKAALLTR